MAEIKIQYCFKLDEQNLDVIDVRLDAHSLEIINSDTDYPEWTRLEFHQCSHCPINSETHLNYPVTTSLGKSVV